MREFWHSWRDFLKHSAFDGNRCLAARWFVDHTAFVSRLCASPARPEHVNIEIGLQRLAYTFVAGALEDSQGRGTYTNKVSRRQQASNAIRWLRKAKNAPPQLRSEFVFSIHWCSMILNVPALTLARHGLPRIQGGGLTAWRQWRSHRNGNRITPRPPITKHCLECDAPFTSTNPAKKFCDQQCMRHHTQRQRYGSAEHAELACV